MADLAAGPLKICVLGPCRAGKTLLCRVLAAQPLAPAGAEYETTTALRVQEVSVSVGSELEPVQVQLWDVSGSPQYRAHWHSLAEGADGVLLVLDPSRAEAAERELEAFYLAFAQPLGLTTKQCMVLAVDAQQGAGAAVGGTLAWQGLRGKLGRLQCGCLSIGGGAAPEAAAREAQQHLAKLLAGCLARKRDRTQRAAAGEGGGER